MRVVTALATGFSLLALAGCAGSGPARVGDLEFDAAWQPWHDDPYPHLIVSFVNYGLGSVSVGPGGHAMTVSGPQGAVRIDWGETPFARPILSQQEVVVAFHPRLDEGGRFVLTIDHAAGIPTKPPAGGYAVCVATSCQNVALGA